VASFQNVQSAAPVGWRVGGKFIGGIHNLAVRLRFLAATRPLDTVTRETIKTIARSIRKPFRKNFRGATARLRPTIQVQTSAAAKSNTRLACLRAPLPGRRWTSRVETSKPVKIRARD